MKQTRKEPQAPRLPLKLDPAVLTSALAAQEKLNGLEINDDLWPKEKAPGGIQRMPADKGDDGGDQREKLFYRRDFRSLRFFQLPAERKYAAAGRVRSLAG